MLLLGVLMIYLVMASTIPISLATVHCYVHRAHGLYGGTFGLFDRRL